MQIIELRRLYESKIMTFGKPTKPGQNLLLHLFSKPALNIQQAAEAMEITFDTASSLSGLFVEENMLNPSLPEWPPQSQFFWYTSLFF